MDYMVLRGPSRKKPVEIKICCILCFVEQERKGSSEVDLFVRWCIFS